MWGAHTPGILVSLEKENILPDAAPWVNLEDTMLSERSQSQRTHIYTDGKWNGLLPGGGGRGGWAVTV